MIVACDCGAKLKIDEAKIAGRKVKVRCPRCGNMLPLQPIPAASPVNAPPSRKAGGGPLILVALDSDIVRSMVADVLVGADFRVETASDGVAALKKALETQPRGLVLDVGLPGIYGFELCERLKENPATQDIKIILLSSVYDMRRYKRTPASLYGADDYIEKHHIADFLPSKMRKLLFPEEFPDEAKKSVRLSKEELPEMSRPPAREFEPSLLGHEAAVQTDRGIPEPSPGRKPSSMPPKTDVHEATAIMPEKISLDASVFQRDECDIFRVDESDPEAVEKAQRFARIIVSDIALYNQETVIEGIRNGTFYELLKTDVEEGRELYEKRVPTAVKAKKDYYQEAFDNFINAAKSKNVR